MKTSAHYKVLYKADINIIKNRIQCQLHAHFLIYLQTNINKSQRGLKTTSSLQIGSNRMSFFLWLPVNSVKAAGNCPTWQQLFVPAPCCCCCCHLISSIFQVRRSSSRRSLFAGQLIVALSLSLSLSLLLFKTRWSSSCCSSSVTLHQQVRSYCSSHRYFLFIHVAAKHVCFSYFLVQHRGTTVLLSLWDTELVELFLYRPTRHCHKTTHKPYICFSLGN